MEPRSGVGSAVPPAVPALFEPAFAPRRVRALGTALGAGRLAGLLAMFRQELADRPARIVEALADRELSRARHESSRLARAALSMGAMEVAGAARRVEAAVVLASTGNRSELVSALRDLRRAAGHTLVGDGCDGRGNLSPERPTA